LHWDDDFELFVWNSVILSLSNVISDEMFAPSCLCPGQLPLRNLPAVETVLLCCEMMQLLPYHLVGIYDLMFRYVVLAVNEVVAAGDEFGLMRSGTKCSLTTTS